MSRNSSQLHHTKLELSNCFAAGELAEGDELKGVDTGCCVLQTSASDGLLDASLTKPGKCTKDS